MKKINYAVVISLLGILLMPALSQAQSVSNTNAASQLQVLLAQLSTLQAEVAAQANGTVLGTQCVNFTQPLGLGSAGSAVTMLQTALKKDGISINATGKFDTQTFSAVNQFQKQYASAILAPSKLTAPTGYVGKATMAQLNVLNGCSGGTPIVAAVNTSSTSTTSAITAPGKLTASQNRAFGTQTVVPGITNQKVGSYSLVASAFEGVNVLNVSIIPDVSYFQNLRLLVNGVQFGATQSVVSQGTSYTFSGTPFAVPAGSMVNVDVYTDILSTASGTASSATTLSGCSGSGMVHFESIMCNEPVQGQGITVSSAGPSLFVTADTSEPVAGDVVMGSTGNTLSVLRFTETSNVENVKVTDLTITDTVSSTASVKPTFSNLTVWEGSTLVGTANAPTVRSATAYAYAIHFANPVIIPQGNSLSLTFKGDVAPYSSGAATDGSVHMFGVTQSSDVVAFGAVSNKSAAVTVQSAEGNPQTVLRTILGASAAPLGAMTGRMKSVADDLGIITAYVNAAGPAALNKVSIEFSGTAATSSLFASNANVSLIDQNGQNVDSADGAVETIGSGGGGGCQPGTCGSSTNYNVTWNFPAGVSGFTIANGNSYTFKLRVNSAVIPGVQNVAESLSAMIGYTTDVSWTDGLDAQALSGIPLAPSNVPLTINSVTYAVGN